MAGLYHPNICRIFGAQLIPNQVVRIIMEFVEGGDLYGLLQSNAYLPWSSIFMFACQATRAVRYLHSRSILHRDIKSENFLVKTIKQNHKDVQVLVLADFGLATKDSTKQSRSTINYSAPEVLQGQPWTTKADIYSLGMVFYELIARDIPFKGVPDGSIKEQVKKGQRPDIPLKCPKVRFHLIFFFFFLKYVYSFCDNMAVGIQSDYRALLGAQSKQSTRRR